MGFCVSEAGAGVDFGGRERVHSCHVGELRRLSRFVRLCDQVAEGIQLFVSCVCISSCSPTWSLPVCEKKLWSDGASAG